MMTSGTRSEQACGLGFPGLEDGASIDDLGAFVKHVLEYEHRSIEFGEDSEKK